nr:ribosomal protein L24 [Cryptomonas borealis]
MANKTKCYLKKGDTVKIISGYAKGKVSEIVQVLRNKNQIIVKEVNIKKKHQKPKKEGGVGQIVKFEAPINASNAMLYSKEYKVISRVSIFKLEDGKKVRILKKIASNQNKNI